MTIPGAVTVTSTMAFATLLFAQERVSPPGSPMDPTLFAAAIVTVLSSLGGMIVLVINSASAARDRRDAAVERRTLLERTAASVDKADTLITSTAEIKELTNSTNSNLQKALELMTEKYTGSQRALAQAQETKKETAAAQAVNDLTRAIAAQPPTSASATPHAPAEASLAKIDTNTAAIEKNTARTEQTVQDLKDQS